MSRNSRSINSKSTNRNTGKSRQTGILTAMERTAVRFPAREYAYRRSGTGSDMRRYNRSHYAAAGTAARPRRAGRRC